MSDTNITKTPPTTRAIETQGAADGVPALPFQSVAPTVARRTPEDSPPTNRTRLRRAVHTGRPGDRSAFRRGRGRHNLPSGVEVPRPGVVGGRQVFVHRTASTRQSFSM